MYAAAAIEIVCGTLKTMFAAAATRPWASLGLRRWYAVASETTADVIPAPSPRSRAR
jgi:hypothetical protein